jgi:hypothetical protein
MLKYWFAFFFLLIFFSVIDLIFFYSKDTETQRKLEMRHRAEEDALYRQFSKKRAEEETNISQIIQVSFDILMIANSFVSFH